MKARAARRLHLGGRPSRLPGHSWPVPSRLVPAEPVDAPDRKTDTDDLVTSVKFSMKNYDTRMDQFRARERIAIREWAQAAGVA